ncbi:phosphoenolpyruvate carboxykinase (GTP) [Archaeoglobales archaeon]|nr:MAG: phosphoenolpyruvate carboxykinase (GTP) [Archaeoglobales archaeon]
MSGNLQELLNKAQFQKLKEIKNPHLHDFIAKYVKLCNPSKVFVCTDSVEDEEYVKKKALEYGEERQLANPNHTVHFDNYYDQARDKENTRILISENIKLPYINTYDRKKGLEEIHKLMEGITEGKELFICFFTLGPPNSPFEIPAIQLTDSAYVAHNEFLLYRKGYEVFKRLKENPRFLKFVHSTGELDERKTSKNLDKRRVYIDLDGEAVLSINTQYGGNSIGLKKLAFRLTIKRAVEEGWLTEHMFIMGVNGPNGRVSYFTGAYPSMCGKTSTCTLIHEKLVGDDIASIRNINGEARAVNAEIGVFGIIEGVNEKDDPAIWEVLNSQNEVIFSNVLVKDGKVYWSGMGIEIPDEGENHSGKWWRGKKDKDGNEIPPSHRNARFTVRLGAFRNVDLEALNSPLGVKISGIIFGGRDADTLPPVSEAFDWVHGVITKGASLESETTAAILGKEGVRKFNPMAILDFLSIPISKYIENYLEFGRKLKHKPKIFAVNYFLRDERGQFLNEKEDKAVWLKWMELRVHDEVQALETPIGFIPCHDDLKVLFDRVLNKDYSKNDYIKQFTIRVPELLAKVDRIEKIYQENVKDTPEILFEVLEEEKDRLMKAKERFGEYISPLNFV